MYDRDYTYVKRKSPKPQSGYTNFYVTPHGTGLKIGSVDHGLMDITPHSIKFRDEARKKQGLKKADW